MKRFLEVLIILGIILSIVYYSNKKFHYLTPEPEAAGLCDSIVEPEPISAETSVTLPFRIVENLMIVKGTIGGSDMDFILDTGCSDVQIGVVEYEFLKRRGAIEGPCDSIMITLADGSISQAITAEIKDFVVAEQNIGPIRCIVSSNPDAPLLMGYNVLKNLGNIQIDHENNIITLIK